jgi:hypothetical protein
MQGPYFIEHGDVWIYTTQPGKPSFFGPNSRHVCDGIEELVIALIGETMVTSPGPEGPGFPSTDGHGRRQGEDVCH